MKLIAIFSIAFASVAFAKAAEAPKPTPPSLTVEQAMGVGQGLKRLTYYTIMTKDKDGRETPVNMPYGPDKPSPHQFNGEVLFTMSVNMQQGDLATRAFQETYQALVRQVYGGPERVPKEGEADAKKEDFAAQMKKIMDAPSGVLVTRIKRDDLCLSASPPRCPVANPIPIDVLSLLLPIIER